jgi:hypothetical protein
VKPSWHGTQPVSPLKDVVVETKIPDSHLVNACLGLHRPGHVFDIVGNLHQTSFVELSFPVLLKGKLKFTVRTHATESKGGGGEVGHGG